MKQKLYLKKKNISKAYAAFFDYLKDDEVKNVHILPARKGGVFEFYQGSKIIRGQL